jgi:hypothetical protein
MSDAPPPPPGSEPPPRKFAFKTPTFPVANPPSSTPSPHGPTDVREHFRHAEAIRRAVAENPLPARENEVHDILRDNLARADAAGLNEVKPVEKRPNRRLRDYLVLVLAFNVPVVALGIHFRHEPVAWVCLLAGGVLFNIRVAWIIWVVNDRY